MSVLRRAGSRAAVEMLEGRVLFTASPIVVDNLTDISASGETDLREAVALANAAGSPATITFQSSLGGSIGLSTVGGSSVGASALLITGDVTIDGTDSGTGLTIDRASGAPTMRLFDVASGASLTLINLTLSGGSAHGGNGGAGDNTGAGGAGLGGAVYVDGGDLTLQQSTFNGNQAVGGNATTRGTLFTGGGGGGLSGNGGAGSSSAAGAGGGPNGGTAPSGTGGAGGGGAGGYTGHTAGGAGGFGGGGGASPRVGGIAGNGGFGGGGGGAPPSGSPGAAGFGGGAGSSTGGGGGAGLGGAVFSNGGNVTISNSTFTANTAQGGTGVHAGQGLGGAIFNRNGTLTIVSSTISSNTAAGGGRGVYTLGDGATATAVADNTIIGQSDTAVSDFVGGTINGGTSTTSGSGDLIRTASGFAGTVVSTADPVLGSLASNGGYTQTLLPGTGSPALSAGDPTVLGGATADQRGLARSAGGLVDMGAVQVFQEFAPSITSAASTLAMIETPFSFTFTTTAAPTPSLSATGTLPTGLTFVDNGDGTATLSGTPAAGATGTYDLTITASNGIGTDAAQSFTLSVDQPLSILSAAGATFTAGQPATFTVSTAGVPAPALSETGALPGGVTFTDNGDGTATISGTPDVGAGGNHTLSIDAGNGVESDATQPFTLTVNQPPAISSAADAVFTAGQSDTFTVTASGFPVPAITNSGTLPAGVTFTDNGDGTATITGTPAADAGGTYLLVLDAGNGVGSDAIQPFTLSVEQAPSIVSAASATFATGQPATFTASTAGFPAPALSETGALPGGVSFVDNGDGTATLSGTPAADAGGTYTLSLDAGNGIGSDATQPFTVTVNQAPSILSAASATFTTGQPSTVTVTTAGFPTAVLSETGTLPAGVTFTDNGDGTASITGTPAAGAGGIYTLSLDAGNGVGSDAIQPFTLSVDQAPSIVSAASATFTTGQFSTVTVTAAGFPAAALTETGALPGGVTFTDNGNDTATIAGTPLPGTGGSYALDLTATNGIGSDATQPFTLNVNQPAALTSAANAVFTAGQSDTFTVTASGVPAPAISNSGTLPAGVTFTDNGDGSASISGTPAAGTGGTYSLSLDADNGVGSDAIQPFTLSVDQAPSIVSAASVTFTTGHAETFTVSTTGFPAPALSETGALPGGLTFTNNGNGTATIAGTPSPDTGGSYALDLTATNGIGNDATQPFTLNVNQPAAISSAANAVFTAGQSDTFTVTASGIPAPAISNSGTLPAGVTFTDNGDGTASISGTPAVDAGGNYVLSLDGGNGVGIEAIQSFTLSVDQVPSIISAASATFTTGQLSTITVTAAGFPAAALNEAGALPGGVTFTDNGNGTATIAGTPSSGTGGSYVLDLTATNGIGSDATQPFTLNVNQPAALTSAAGVVFTAGQSDTFTVTASGIPAPAISNSGTLPAGVTFTDNGDGTATITGTPAVGTGGTYALSIDAGNGVGSDDTQPFTLSVDQSPSILSAHDDTFTAGQLSSFTVSTAGFPASALTETGALPIGVTFVDNGDGTAAISGTPAADSGGSYPLDIDAGNSIGSDATQSFTLTVDQAPSILSPASATFTTGQLSTFTVTAAGFPTVALSETGTLPGGVSFTDNGDGTATITGAPAGNAGGTYALSIEAGNDVGSDATQSYMLTVNQPPTVSSAASAIFATGEPSTITVTTAGFPAAAITETGALPGGLNFTDNGDGTATIAGTPAPDTGGIYTLNLDAGNGIGSDAAQSFTLTVDQAPSILNAASATFITGQPSSITVATAAFPVAALSETGALPAGVSFIDNGDGTATLSGVPAAATGGIYALGLTATNGTGGNATQSFTLTVDEAPSILSGTSATFITGQPLTITVSAAGFPVAALSETGALPAGVSFVDNGDGTATLSGVPAAATGGIYALGLTATNGPGEDATQSFTLTVNQPPAITNAPSAVFTAGQSGTFTIAASGFPVPAITLSGTLPAGLTFADNGDGTAAISGTPASGTVGAYSLTTTASNGIFPDASQPLVLTVNPAQVTIDLTTPALTYDGSPQSATSSTTPPAIGVSYTYDGSSSVPIDAGTYAVVADSGDPDYAGTASGTMVIAPATPTISIAVPSSAVYDALAQGATATVNGVTGGAAPGSATLSYFEGNDTTGTVLPGAPVDAGTYTVEATYTGSLDYQSADQTATYAIAPASATLNLVTPASAVYDGTPKPATASVAGIPLGASPDAATILYFAGQTHDGTLLPDAPTEPGTYTALATHAADSDYAFVNEALAYTISRATPFITIDAANLPFNGQPRPITVTVTGTAFGADPGPATLTYFAGTSASGTPLSGVPSAVGIYTVEATYTGDAEYAPVVATATYTLYGNPTVFPVSGTGQSGLNILLDPLSSATSADGGSLSLTVLTQPALGSVSIVTVGANQELLYRPGPGAFTNDSFTYQVNDRFGGATTATATVNYSGIGLVSSYLNPGRQDLVVIESGGNHSVAFANAPGARVKVTVDGAVQGAYVVTGRVFGFAPAGNDTFNGKATSAPLWFYGGAGIDTFIGGSSSDVFIGGPGNDSLNGRAGRNLLIGGGGTNSLAGSKGSNILVAGTTIYDAPTLANQSALLQILSAWQTSKTTPNLPSGNGSGLGGIGTPVLDGRP